jgi:Helix-turn-helix domain
MDTTHITKGTRLTGDARAILLADLLYKYVDLYMTIRALAADTGRAYGTIHRMLAAVGVLRSKGGKPRPGSTA